MRYKFFGERSKGVKIKEKTAGEFIRDLLELFDSLVAERSKACPEFRLAELGDPLPFGGWRGRFRILFRAFGV